MNKVLLIDSNSIINRAYYAMPTLINKKGQPTGAVFGYLAMLVKMIDNVSPTHIVAAFDLKGPTFRHKMYDQYKANRKGMPDELAEQLPILKDVLNTMGIKIVEKSGFEADDVLGTLAKKFEDKVIVLSGDKDCLQLVSDSTEVWLTKKGVSEVEKYTYEKMEQNNFLPYQVIEYKALCGDSADNIKGVKGVGDKTAKSLLEKYNNVENVYAHIDEIKGKLAEKLINDKESAILSKKLATINQYVDLECDFKETEFKYPFDRIVLDKFNELEFTSLIKRFKFDDCNNLSENENKEENQEVKLEIKKIEIKTYEELEKILESVKSNISVYFYKQISFAIDNQLIEYNVKIIEGLFSDGLDYAKAIKSFEKIFLNPNIEKIVFDYKLFKHFLDSYETQIDDNYFDILLAGYLVKGGKHYKKIDDLLVEFGYLKENIAVEINLLKNKLKKDLINENLEKLYLEIEKPLENVLYIMEKNGVCVDIDFLNELSDSFTNELAGLTNKIYELAGEKFNINSPKQLGHILFENLNLPYQKKTKTGYSTNEETLLKLENKHPIIEYILRYRKISKLNSTYIEGMKILVVDGKIHTTFMQTVTSTGRLSSIQPNLQNIPSRDAEGSLIRKIFVASEGNVLISSDYSQIELRLLAHFAGDKNLQNAYENADDIHAITASEIFGIPLNEVTSEIRRNAKAVNFGIIYGISGFGLANNLSISNFKAQNYINTYFEKYPKIKDYMDSNVKFAKEHGYTITLFGRKRFIPEIKSSKYLVRNFGERAAMNMPLQGTAADIIKIAMIKVQNAIEKNNLKAKLILQIHDELIIDCPVSEEKIVIKLLKEEMENAVKLNVPLVADVGSGKNWMECK